MVIIKSPREINLMREAGHILGLTLESLESFIRPGISTMDISKEVERIFESHGARSAEKGYEGYPEAACVSVNEVILHGIPSDRKILRDGDIVSVDLVVEKAGYMSDACRTYLVGICGERAKKIVEASKMCFDNALALIKPGATVGDIGHMVECTAKSLGYSVVREFTGHGIGTHMHEDPYIPNYGKPSSGTVLKEGMTICVEPMILEGRPDVRILKDGWTVVSRDGKLTSHYENTILVTKDGYEILSKI